MQKQAIKKSFEQGGVTRVWVHTCSLDHKNALKKQEWIQNALRKSGVDHARIGTHESYVQPLMNLFKRREARR